jgi:hypothetical protein
MVNPRVHRVAFPGGGLGRNARTCISHRPPLLPGENINNSRWSTYIYNSRTRAPKKGLPVASVCALDLNSLPYRL